MPRMAPASHAREIITDAALASLGFAGPAAALLLPRLPQLGARPLSVEALRLAYRARWLSLGAATAALLALARRRRSPEKKVALAADALAVAALLGTAPRLYRTELGLTRIGNLRHLGPEAHALVHDAAEVAGAFIGGRAVAYPVARLATARPFLDHVGGVAIVPVVDRRSHAAMAVVSPADRPMRPVQLGTPENHVLLYDRASGNAFRAITGIVEAGPDRGARLELLPLLRCTWSAWKSLHPETALAWWDAPFAHALLHRFATRELTLRHVPEEPLTRPLDPRLAPAELVFGVRAGGVAHAFTRFHLREKHLVELKLGGRPVAVLFDPALDVAMAFFAELDGQPLELSPYAGRHAVAQDDRDDLWDVTGRCIKGSAYGKRLAPVPLSIDRVFWFAWAHFHPHTGLDGWASTAQQYAFARS